MNSYLSIAPCREGWENMGPSENGRFCNSCKKEVRDFSSSTLGEIKTAYSENNGELCGHVPVKLLQEEHFAKHLEQGHYSHLKKFWIAAVFCFGASLFNVNAAKASTFYKIRTAVFQFAERTTGDSITVSGMVKDHNTGSIIPFVTIEVWLNGSVIKRTTTDIEGKYLVKIPQEIDKVDLKAIYIGYMPKIMSGIHLSAGKQIVVDFEVEEMEYLLDGVMIMEEPAKKSKVKD